MNIGGSNRPIYDNCAYQKKLYESTSPLDYYLYQGKFENCSKCLHDKFWTPYQLVDIETELRNQNRPLSKCDQFKYNPNCKKSDLCLSTFDKSVPIVLAPEVCPIVHNNIPKRKDVGYNVPNQTPCGRRKN
uniref:Uncharacterized protein n=1 Tax=viral metagenome TaxID=1070528 RepID=A0A6C0AC28_9ZZZZ